MSPLLAHARLVGLSVLLMACDRTPETEQQSGATERSEAAPAAPALTLSFLERGLDALQQETGQGVHVLELRATGRQLSLQVELGGKLSQIDYVEVASEGSAVSGPGVAASGDVSQGDAPARDLATAPREPARSGRVWGPDVVEVVGEGPLEANLFPLGDVDVAGIARAFSVARRAVDPVGGRVTRLVVRRFLPFSEKVRARIYVDSPRMSGSIDTNERGVPLKRR